MIQQAANKQLTESMLVAVRVLYWPAVWFVIVVRVVWQDRAFVERERGLAPTAAAVSWNDTVLSLVSGVVPAVADGSTVATDA